MEKRDLKWSAEYVERVGSSLEGCPERKATCYGRKAKERFIGGDLRPTPELLAARLGSIRLDSASRRMAGVGLRHKTRAVRAHKRVR